MHSKIIRLIFVHSRLLQAAGIFIICVNLVFLLLNNLSLFQKKFDAVKVENVYQSSQYNALYNEFKGWIDDDDLYSLAGLKYIGFEDPSKINFELQPLGKYIIGIFILVFGNAIIGQYFLGIILLILTYFSAKKIMPNPFISILPSLLLSFDLLFKENLVKVNLDIIQTVTVQIFILLLFISFKEKRFLYIPMIWLGVVSLSKSFSIGMQLYLVLIVFLILRKKDLVFKYIINTFWTVATYLFGYLVFFRYHNLFDFFTLHLNIIKLYRSYVPEYPKGEIFRIIFTGFWRKWWGDFGFNRVESWSFLWPGSVLSLIIVLINLCRKINNFLLFQLIWVIVYLSATSLRLVFPRYLLLILPNLYILLIYSCYSLLRRLQYGDWN